MILRTQVYTFNAREAAQFEEMGIANATVSEELKDVWISINDIEWIGDNDTEWDGDLIPCTCISMKSGDRFMVPGHPSEYIAVLGIYDSRFVDIIEI